MQEQSYIRCLLHCYLVPFKKEEGEEIISNSFAHLKCFASSEQMVFMCKCHWAHDNLTMSWFYYLNYLTVATSLQTSLLLDGPVVNA